MATPYLRDVYSPEEVPDLEGADFRCSPRFGQHLVNGLDYRDPDKNCLRLYTDLRDLLFPGDDIGSQHGQLFISHEGIPFTSDYIGPSMTSMKKAGLPDEQIWSYALRGRVFGGHLAWPRLFGGINMSKASSGAITDRMDVCLYELRAFLDNTGEPALNPKLRDALIMPQNSRWLHSFGTFRAFCDWARLRGSFVTEDCRIIWFAPTDAPRPTREAMEAYAENDIRAIEARQRLIE